MAVQKTNMLTFSPNIYKLLQHENIEDNKQRFQQLQNQFASEFATIFPDKMALKTIVVIPSLTVDQEILTKVRGHFFYEERLLCLLMLLRMPRTHVIYVTSVPIDPVIVDYYLHLLPGITGFHARERLTLLSCFDASAKSLTEKILERPRLIERIKNCIPQNSPAHITCFNTTELERVLAVKLGLPVYACNPDLNFLGTKSGNRKIFKACGAPAPDGFEDVRNRNEIVHCLVQLKKSNLKLEKAVIKMNDGFSGDGNAVFFYDNAVANNDLEEWISKKFEDQLKVIAAQLGTSTFISKFETTGGIVEEFIEGEIKASPSVQCRINPLGQIDILSTHDQMMGGEDGQVFLGATFPANEEYAKELAVIAYPIAEELKKHGVLGRFGIDFVSVKENNQWKHYVAEINLRKGGTTHPYIMLQFLTEGDYDAASGKFYMNDGKQRYYIATDNLQSDSYKGITPYDLMDIAIYNGLHYNGATEEGVTFHLIGALSQYGKVGVVCIGSTPDRAKAYFNKIIEVLDKECKSHKETDYS